jgi:probable rRNA maturation factor
VRDALAAEIDVLVEVALPEGAEPGQLVDLVTHALAAEDQSGDWRIAVMLTTDAALRALHRDFMGLDTETDVMTFPADPEPGSEARGGDIVISVERATENGADAGHTAWDEVRFLAVHGTLHLCGWRDDDDADRALMLARQFEIIAGWRMIERG